MKYLQKFLGWLFGPKPLEEATQAQPQPEAEEQWRSPRIREEANRMQAIKDSGGTEFCLSDGDYNFGDIQYLHEKAAGLGLTWVWI